jgi:hypothetical protein
VFKPPRIKEGQIYLHLVLQEYIVVTRVDYDRVMFNGFGIMGISGNEEFLEYFPPVDPADLEEWEEAELQGMSKVPLRLH